MEFIRKGGGEGLDPIHNLGAHFCASRVKEFCVLNIGLLTLLGTFPKSLFKIWPFWVFLENFVFLLFGDQKSNVPHGFHNLQKKRGGGQTPYGRIPYLICFFLVECFPKQSIGASL